MGSPVPPTISPTKEHHVLCYPKSYHHRKRETDAETETDAQRLGKTVKFFHRQRKVGQNTSSYPLSTCIYTNGEDGVFCGQDKEFFMMDKKKQSKLIGI